MQIKYSPNKTGMKTYHSVWCEPKSRPLNCKGSYLLRDHGRDKQWLLWCIPRSVERRPQCSSYRSLFDKKWPIDYCRMCWCDFRQMLFQSLGCERNNLWVCLGILWRGCRFRQLQWSCQLVAFSGQEHCTSNNLQCSYSLKKKIK